MFNSVFDELKEVNYFKEIADSKSLIVTPYKVKYVKQINRMKSLWKVEAHLEPKRASTMELFLNIPFSQ